MVQPVIDIMERDFGDGEVGRPDRVGHRPSDGQLRQL